MQVRTIVTDPPVGAPVSDNFRQFNTAPDKSLPGKTEPVFEKLDQLFMIGYRAKVEML